jgi:hypothetical protein
MAGSHAGEPEGQVIAAVNVPLPGLLRPCASCYVWQYMSKSVLLFCGVGLAGLLVVVGIILYIQRGAHLDLPGQILKVRTAQLEDGSSAAIADFRVANTSDYPAVVRTVKVVLEDQKGNRIDGTTIADIDARRMMEGIPLLGQKYSKSLVVKDTIPGRASWDRMIAARFEVPEEQLRQRKGLIVSIEEIDGKIFELSENPAK